MTKQSISYPRIGVAAIIIKDDKVLLGERINAHGNGTWAFPGGHLEFGEPFEACAQREVFEETGLQIEHFECVGLTNDIFTADNLHYVTVFLLAHIENGTPKVLEPKKCRQWQWYNPEKLPEPLFLPIQNLLKNAPNFDKIIAATRL